MWFLIIVFGILSLIFFLGKGSWLIAGYNTASQKEKSKYDEKKLCNVMATGCLILCVTFIIIELKESLAMYVLPAGITLSLLVMFLGGNVFSVKKVDKNKKSLVINIVVSLVIGAFVIIVLFIGDVKITLNDAFLNADASLTTSYDVYYKNIDQIEYVENLELGSRVGGIGNFRIQAGNFKNEEFGKYKLYSYVKCKDYIVLKVGQQYVVINGKDEKQTKELYHQMQSFINKEDGKR